MADRKRARYEVNPTAMDSVRAIGREISARVKRSSGAAARAGRAIQNRPQQVNRIVDAASGKARPHRRSK